VILAVAGTVFVGVLVAELVGDKTLYTLSALAARHRVVAVLLGAFVAFALKMLVASLFGEMLARLPRGWIAVASALTFYATAVQLYFKGRRTPEAPEKPASTGRAVMLGFAAIALTEWADVGQITAALFVARFHRWVIVWIAATLALWTKGTLAVTVGVGLRRWVPIAVLRPISVGLCLLMGTLALLRFD
jgi:putative Ca2+/H+ antiporter (TMEM165/GDT1 family)